MGLQRVPGGAVYGATFRTVTKCFSALSSHLAQVDPAASLQPLPLFQGMQQGLGSTGGAAKELASCCASSIDDKFGIGSTKSLIKRSWAERRATELRASFCSWTSYSSLSSSLWHRVLLFLCLPPDPRLHPSDRCGNPQTKTTLGTAGSVWGCGAKAEREPARGREKKKDGLRINMPFGKRQI